jgi:hypothetical protein
MALSSQHLAKIDKSAIMISEMHTHRSAAMQLFRDALGSSSFEPVLDTLVILINFEASIPSHRMTTSDEVRRSVSQRTESGVCI